MGLGSFGRKVVGAAKKVKKAVDVVSNVVGAGSSGGGPAGPVINNAATSAGAGEGSPIQTVTNNPVVTNTVNNPPPDVAPEPKPVKYDRDNPPPTTMIAPNRVEIPGASFAYYNAIGRAPYNIVDPQKFAQKYSTFNRQQIIQNYNIANKMALKQLDTELQGLNNFVPAAAALKRSETSADNQFNQAQRTAQVNAALPNAQRQLNEQAARAESFASGRMPSEIEDRALELTARSSAADNAALAGFGAGSSVARKASDLMSVQQRLQLSQYGDQLLNSNISNQANLFLAPTQYSNAGAEVRVMPTLSGSQLAGQIGSEINSSTLLPTAAALQTTIAQNQFDTQLAQRTAEFNASNEMATSQFNTNAANQFAMAGFQYNVGYEGAVAGAANATTMNNIGVWQQQQYYHTMQDYMNQSQNSGLMQSLGSIGGAIIGGIATDGSMQGISMGAQIGSQFGNLLSGGSPSGAPSINAGSFGGSSGTTSGANDKAFNAAYDNEVAQLFPSSEVTPAAGISAQGTIDTAPAPTPVASEPAQQTSNPQLMQFSAATGVPMAFTGQDNQAATQRILSAGNGVAFASGIGYANSPGMQPIGESASGPLFGSTARLGDSSLSSGPAAIGTAAVALDAMGLMSSTANSSVSPESNLSIFRDIAAKSADPDFISNLDQLAANGDTTGFMNDLMEATGKGTLESAKGANLDSKANAFAAYKLSEAWNSMSPGMKSSAIANFGLLNLKDAGGTKFSDRVIPATAGSPYGELTVGKGLDLLQKGINVASLVSEWDQVNDVAKLALGDNPTVDAVAEYAREIGMLGSGKDGRAVPTSAEELAAAGWHAAPEQGVGAIRADRDTFIPKGYTGIYQTDTYRVALPNNMIDTATGSKSTLTKTAVGMDGISASADAIHDKWEGSGKIPADKGTVGGKAAIAAYKLLSKSNPTAASSLTASTLVDPNEKVNYKNDLSYTNYLGKKSLSVLVAGNKKAKSSDIEGKLPEGPMTAENFTRSMKELRAQYAKSGIKNKADAYALSNQAYAEGRINEADLIGMQKTFNMVFDNDGYVQAKKLTFGREKGIELAMSRSDEPAFRSWFTRMAKANNLDSNPDDPRHQYDYRSFWQRYVKDNPKNKNFFGIPDISDNFRRHFPDDYKAKGYTPANEASLQTRMKSRFTDIPGEADSRERIETATPPATPTPPASPALRANAPRATSTPRYKATPMLTKEEVKARNAEYFSSRGA